MFAKIKPIMISLGLAAFLTGAATAQNNIGGYSHVYQTRIMNQERGLTPNPYIYNNNARANNNGYYYDANGNRVNAQNNGYYYDANGNRVSTANNGYYYDGNGNRRTSTTVQGYYPDANGYYYDANGNRVNARSSNGINLGPIRINY